MADQRVPDTLYANVPPRLHEQETELKANLAYGPVITVTVNN